VGLARAVKGAGYRAILVDGGPLVYTRMYNSPAEVWRGYSKNLYAFFGNPIFLMLGVLVLFAYYVAPPLFVLGGLATGKVSAELVYLPLAHYVAGTLARLIISVRFRFRAVDALFHPISIAMLIALCINSMLWSLRGKTSWKGRRAVSAD
jgi:chlorobactene glucosyltransferase